MQANELRINNLIAVKGFCVKVSKETFKHIEDGKVLEAEPIPLTEEWLIKFGFEKSIDEYWTIDGSSLWWLLSKSKNVGIKLMDNEVFGVMNRYKIEYVHQLQNLYFALTGKELTIKE